MAAKYFMLRPFDANPKMSARVPDEHRRQNGSSYGFEDFLRCGICTPGLMSHLVTPALQQTILSLAHKRDKEGIKDVLYGSVGDITGQAWYLRPPRRI